jgi:hypothetical protein
LERFNKNLADGIPTDSRAVDDYLSSMATTQGLLVQWLEDFKSRFGDYSEAAAVIAQVEDSLKLYQRVIGDSAAKVTIQKAIEARAPQSVLV